MARPPLLPHRSAPPRPRRVGLVALVVAAAVVLGACSSGSSDTPEGPTAEEAARLLAAGYSLEASHEQCFRDAFEDDAAATAALAVGGSAPADQQDALRGVLEACISAEDLAGIVAGSVRGGVPGTGDDQQECLRQATLALPEERRSTLALGLALSGDATPDELDAQLGSITSELFRACGVGIGGDAPGSTGSSAPASSTTAPATP